MHIIIGLEHHCKGQIDGYFSQLNSSADRACQQQDIVELDALVEVWRRAFEAKQELHGDCDREVFIHYLPKMQRAKAESDSVLLTPSSLPVGVKASHCWRFVVNDRRRLRGSHSLIGKNNYVTGVDTTALLLPSLRGAAERTCFLQVATTAEQKKDAENEDAPEEEAEVPPEALPYNVNTYMGWRSSYRKTRPEDMVAEEEKDLGKKG